VLVVERSRCAHAIAVIDGFGDIPSAVPALVVSAGCGDDQVARTLLDRRVLYVSEVQQGNGEPCGHMTHKLAARAAGLGEVMVQRCFSSRLESCGCITTQSFFAPE
jgi:hypothetical protein